MQEQLRDGELAQVMKYLEDGELPIDGEEALRVMNLSDHTALLPPGYYIDEQIKLIRNKNIRG